MTVQLAFSAEKREPDPSLKRNLLKTAGLFAGVGGIERGLEKAGHETKLLCEIDPAAREVLKAHFAVPKHRFPEDIAELAALPRETQLVAAGFPCQDLSQAGRVEGIDGARSGLVLHVFRLLEQRIEEGRPVQWVLLENVPFMLQLSKGRAMEVVIAELERLNYRWAYRVVDALAFGLPQRRERVYIVASRRGDPRRVLFADEAGVPERSRDTNGATAFGFYWTEGTRGLGWAVDAVPTLKGGSSVGVPSPPAIWLPSGEIVTPDIRDAERLQGFPRSWTRPAERVARSGFRWKLVGNAVSVGVAEWIGERLASPGEPVPLRPAELPVGAPWPKSAWNVGAGRFTAPYSTWPRRGRRKRLTDFLLMEPRLLSRRATAGFYSRAANSRLRIRPDFLDAVRLHLERMERLAAG